MGAEQARAAALKRGANPESVEVLTWERKVSLILTLTLALTLTLTLTLTLFLT